MDTPEHLCPRVGGDVEEPACLHRALPFLDGCISDFGHHDCRTNIRLWRVTVDAGPGRVFEASRVPIVKLRNMTVPGSALYIDRYSSGTTTSNGSKARCSVYCVLHLEHNSGVSITKSRLCTAHCAAFPHPEGHMIR